MYDDLEPTMPRRAVTAHANTIDLSIIYVNWNSSTLIADSIRSLDRSGTKCRYEILIADNASTDGSQEWLQALASRDPRVRCVFNEQNCGFGVGNNSALPLCRGRHILFLNNDTLLLEPLDSLVAAADALGDRCGALAGRVLNADRTIQLTARDQYTLPVIISGFTFAMLGKRSGWVRRQELEGWDHATERDVAMLSGCYMLVPRRVLDAVGAFEPRIFLFYEDADLCYRIRQAGYIVRYVPTATIVHLEGGSRDPDKHVSPLSLGSSLASARFFTARYLGKGQERILTTTVRLFWIALWLLFAPLSAIIPQARLRSTLRRRAQLMRRVLADMPRLRIRETAPSHSQLTTLP